MGRESAGVRPSRRKSLPTMACWWELLVLVLLWTPRAEERMKNRSGRERVEVSSLGVMYCMADDDNEDGRVTITRTTWSWSTTVNFDGSVGWMVEMAGARGRNLAKKLRHFGGKAPRRGFGGKGGFSGPHKKNLRRSPPPPSCIAIAILPYIL